MYRTSLDRRFLKIKKDIRSAFITLVMKKGINNISISDIAREADINRMTFYAHYDTVSDIFQEFIDDMEKEITESVAKEESFNLDNFFLLLNSLMLKEIDFFRFVAKEESCSAFCTAFRKTICRILVLEKNEESSPVKNVIAGDMAASCISYAYLDWLSGMYGDISLDEMISIVKEVLKGRAEHLRYGEV